MVIGRRDGGSAVAISLACQQPGQDVIATRHDVSSSVRKGGNTVERIVACVLVGFIRISLAGGQPRSGVVSPGRHVSIRSFSRISRDSFRGTAERRQAGDLVRIVVREHGWLNRRSPFGLLASPGVIGITSRLAHGVGDAGRLVQRLPVGIGRAVFRGIRHGKEAQGCIVHFRRGIAAAVRIVSEERFLCPKAQHFKDMTGDIFADAAVAVTHIPISAGLWRELEHIAMSLIGDIDFIPIGSAVSADAVD